MFKKILVTIDGSDPAKLASRAPPGSQDINELYRTRVDVVGGIPLAYTSTSLPSGTPLYS
jgi:hypothetical protein